jgi:hypothetical protein
VGGATLATAAAAPSAGQVEKTFGRTAVGTTFGFPGADYKYGSRYTLPENGTVTKITAHMRGRLAGGATGGATQRFRMMIYASDGPGGDPGTLLATSAERVIADNAPEANYEFTVQPGVALPAGSYWLMQQSGASGSQVGLSEQIVSPGNQRFNADLYGDGPSNPAGAVSADPKEYVIFATYLTSATGGGGNDVVICHKPGTPTQQTLSVPVQALESHLAHGDRRGAC